MKEHSDSDERSSFLESISSVANYQTTDLVLDIHFQNASAIANVFWRPQLTFHPFKYGDDLVEFDDLWPKGDHLGTVLECFKSGDMRDVAMDCGKLLLRCGPTRALEKMVQMNIIGKG